MLSALARARPGAGSGRGPPAHPPSEIRYTPVCLVGGRRGGVASPLHAGPSPLPRRRLSSPAAGASAGSGPGGGHSPATTTTTAAAAAATASAAPPPPPPSSRPARRMPAGAAASASAVSAPLAPATSDLDGVLQLRSLLRAAGAGAGTTHTTSLADASTSSPVTGIATLTDANGVPYTGARAAKEAARRAKISAAAKGRPPWNAGRSHSAETRAKIGAATRAAMAQPEVAAKLKRTSSLRR